MIREEYLMKCVNCEPKYNVFNNGFIYPLRIINMLILTIVICNETYSTYTMSLVSLWNFTYLLVALSWLGLLLSALKMILNGDSNTQQLYNEIMDFDTETKSNLSLQRDWMCFFICGVVFWLVLAEGIMLLSLSNLGPISVLVSMASLYINTLAIRIAMLKYVIAKRLRYLRTAEKYMAQVEDMILFCRKILECDSCLQKSHGLLLMAFSINSFLMMIYPLYTFWANYGAGNKVPDAYADHIVPAVLWNSGIWLISLLVATTSSMVSDEVAEVKLELDISWSCRPCTVIQRRLIYLFLMELHQCNGNQSALGFIDISRSTMSTACAVATSYLLVLIQYT